jgi:hypothetical protein
MKKKTIFKDRYVIAEGYPWAYGTKNYKEIGLNKTPVGMIPIEMDFPKELWNKDVPKYKLVLERIQ